MAANVKPPRGNLSKVSKISGFLAQTSNWHHLCERGLTVPPIKPDTPWQSGVREMPGAENNPLPAAVRQSISL